MHYSNKIIIEEVDGQLLVVGEEFTLIDWGNAIIVAKDDMNKTMNITLHLEGDFKITKNKIGWLSKDQKLVNVTLTIIGNLLTVPSLPSKKKGDNTDWKTLINPNLKTKIACVGEEAMLNLSKGQKLQIMRKGYFIVHDVTNDNELVLVDIPDGKQSK